ncbi:MAG: ABC transporter ATP-binding protein, partial [Nitrospirae bacterium]
MSRNEKKVNIISGVSFGIKKGEIFGLVGESGSGKSLTALSIMRLVPPFMNIEGEVFFRQKNQMTDLLSLPADEVRKIRGNSIAMVFQEPMTSLNPVFTIGRQIGEVLEIHRGLSKRESRERA